MIFLRYLFIFAIIFSLIGCGHSLLTGIVYTHITVPLSKNLKNTPSAIVIHANGKIYEIKEPISGYGFYTKVNSNAIGDIAKENGIKEIWYADQEIFSILGIWNTEKVHVYGR